MYLFTQGAALGYVLMPLRGVLLLWLIAHAQCACRVFSPNKVYSRENLLNIVWGYEYPGDVRTVDVHIRRLREKIETNPSEPKYVHTKWGVGYYFQAQ